MVPDVFLGLVVGWFSSFNLGPSDSPAEALVGDAYLLSSVFVLKFINGLIVVVAGDVFLDGFGLGPTV